MLTHLRKTWPYAVALGVAYLAVPLIGGVVLDAQGADPSARTGLLTTSLLGYFPSMTFCVAMFVGYRQGFAWLLAPLVALAFVPAAFVVYNDSALAYTLAYAVFAVIGLAAGAGLRRLTAPRGRAEHR